MSDDAGDQTETELWRRERSPRWKVLDPAGEDRGGGAHSAVYSTVYVADELIIDEGTTDDDTLTELRSLANDAGWSIDEEVAFEDPFFDELSQSLVPRTPGPGGSRRVRISVGNNSGRQIVAETPDAWDLLRQLQHNRGPVGVTLNHVLTTDSLGVNPFKANPFKANPFKANPFKANPFKANAAGVGIDSYASPGFGGRQPVTYVGPRPQRNEEVGDRPVVAILDTGLGEHSWFQGARLVPRLASGEPIGIINAPSNPEVHPSLATPLDGIFDDAAGHGTFIAGIVLQQCPDVSILAVRISDGEGNIIENDLIGALGRLIAYMEEGNRVDLLNLSFSYYHETPDDPSTVSAMRALLQDLRGRGVVIVCSAGNEATDRPTFPAALDRDPAQHVSVGALNPASHSVALFSNIGSWVDVYAPGVSLVSTVPEDFNGGVQAGTRDDLRNRRRMTVDIDDFRGGFGVWSGTSFAAPVVAGKIAAELLAGRSAHDATTEVLAGLRSRDHSRLV